MPGVGLNATLSGAGAKLSIMIEIEGGTERVGGALAESCMEGPGLTTQLDENRDKKKQAVRESSHRKWLGQPTRSPGLRLIRACLSNVSGASLPLAATLCR
jgi:hypothetical protein